LASRLAPIWANKLARDSPPALLPLEPLLHDVLPPAGRRGDT